MLTINETTLTEITRRLVATYQPEQVVLFGSHAWGEPDEDSDVDLLVVVSESSEPAHARVELNQQLTMLAFQPVPPHPCA